MLTQPAISAVEKWRFTPFTSNGEATKAVVTLGFDFRPVAATAAETLDEDEMDFNHETPDELSRDHRS